MAVYLKSPWYVKGFIIKRKHGGFDYEPVYRLPYELWLAFRYWVRGE